MKVLMIGGTGRISTAVSQLAVKKKIDLWLLNRGKHNDKVPKKAHILVGDIYQPDEIKQLLEGHFFDTIVQWISFTEDHVKRDVELFKPFTNHFIFISSASVYQKPVQSLPVTEDAALGNEYWEYSRNKQKCEEYLRSIQSKDFQVTIVRPAHTYDETTVVSELKSYAHPFTIVDRVLKGKKIIILDQGLGLWTLTSNKDFANAFVDLFGNKKTYGETYHLTSEFVYTWDRLYEMIGETLEMKVKAIYIPTDFVLQYFPELIGDLKGDKNHDFYFDNSKIKSVAPNYTSEIDYGNNLKIAIKRFLKNKDLQTVDVDFSRKYDECIKAFESTFTQK
jgi:nucleoside-diphosphate-sugar epimerase